MNKIKILLIIYFLIQNGCGIYSITGASIPAGTETFQVNYFENKAGNRPGSTVEPGLDRDFTIATIAAPTKMVETSTLSEEETQESEEQETSEENKEKSESDDKDEK